MKNILVIGGAGFIGSHLAEQLIDKGCRVKVLVRRTSNTDFLKFLGKEFHTGDLLDKNSLTQALQGVDTIFCAVNIKPAGKSKEDYEQELFRVHVEGTKNLLDACRESGVRRIIYFSSVAAMGYEQGVSFYDNSFKGIPVDAYGRAKLEAEIILNAASANKEADITILRPPGVFGERGLGALTKIIFFIEKGVVPVIGGGNNKQSIAYVGNIVHQAICAAQNENSIGKTYIIGDDRAYSVNELINTVCTVMNKRPFKIHVPVSLTMAAVYLLNHAGFILLKREIISRENIIAIATERIFDSSGFFKELEYEQEYGLDRSVACTIKWYQDKKNE